MTPSGNLKRLPKTDLVALDKVRSTLSAIWLGGGSVITIVVVIQSLLGHFGDKAQEAWSWLLPTIMPTLGMIVAVLGYTALDPRRQVSVVRRSFFRMALWLSSFYLLLVLLTIVMQPFTGKDPLELMHTSNLWLGPIQGLVASSLGVLFVSKRPKRDDGEG